MRYSVTVDDKHIRGWLNKMQSDAIEDAIDGAVEDVAREAANDMSALAPVDTGHLKRTLTAARSVVQKRAGEWLIMNGTEYTIRQNFEHRSKGGFVTKPYEMANAKFVAEIARAVEKVLR